MIGRLFRAHGEFCASHPWEVIVALLTITACMLTVDKTSTLDAAAATATTTATVSATATAGVPNGPAAPPIMAPPSATSSRHRPCHGWSQSCDGLEAEYNAADVILMTIVRCTAVLYCYYQFCSLHRLGSKYVLGIAGLFTVFSSFIFTTAIIKFLGSDISDLKDALFFLLLVIDLSNSGRLAQLALSGSSQAEVTQNIARGLELLGPAISLDTIVEALLVGVGTLSGVQRLEVLCMFAVLSVLVNYVVFMTFYPACLSLIFDLSRNGVDMSVVRERAKGSLLLKSLTEEEQKANPVLQRVKLIMTTGLMIVHIYSRVVFTSSDYDAVDKTLSPTLNLNVNNNRTESGEITDIIIKWLTMSADHIVISIVLIALVVKFICFDQRDPLQDQLRQATLAKASQTTPQPEEEKEQPQPQQLAIKAPPRLPLFSIEEQQVSNVATQTDVQAIVRQRVELPKRPPRPLQECLQLLNATDETDHALTGPQALTDEEIVAIVNAGGTHCPLYKIESVLDDPERGIRLRRQIIASRAKVRLGSLESLPYQHFDYRKVMNACCENVLGYVPIPVGYAGPLLLDGVSYYVPMATTEGALVASTNRGCKALSVRGVRSVVEDVGMTRAPCVRFPSVARASEAKLWIEHETNYKLIKEEFDSTSRFGRLKDCHIAMDGPQLYIRFVALTGDAMGMNMVSKGAEMALRCIKRQFPDMQIISLSGNFCCDKKPAAINWIKGRGKRVVTECTIPAATLRSVLKTDAKTLVECNKLKNMGGSAMAGSIGGNNAHAANMVTAVFLATGQDPAQNVTSSNCSTAMECWTENSEDLYMTCTMPSLEVGTVGGGTGLPGQGACLDMLGVRGAHASNPGDNAKKLAQIVCATVMAGELSLMAALVNSDLVKSHMRHNRSSIAVSSVNNPLNVSVSSCSTIS
ncbi:3-hydroxy-3-methylglutaryl-coenzyme A reductase [Drosophila sulfurigaster albostrigata]|uniref:3-hydroxy-3-methylglutaryl coenzyme A reductase n=1 Tax=Drosophila albomicans TaxID=7291 RepID=A0A6P8ZDS6_DROAB|nr:3-hydroxy-3-methylglutaryl-coenzyme A reductase [Drosophila albomicans]XP_034115166.1 3-hydroxy-3-methylglutaryl-coenzyme A reductase [Drosophila albomicans]XP_051864210.1 3-hydroxy-3-methylglutaryl-coenzyme A reductase [Drosophila albomicans]XP_062124294.1 3-hydroxy-3-methylglutaryl-coenzyme A reductase [Drosophila sulfurigaster albostrigata]XP_062124295.1 3-hydroxy-3-methylglutaryl-coenzyme A reductase [Drosophila sulfurigaster albostrigata]XP_062124296.1 3-hydroxy-3-methylglutaryl-coenzy